MSTNISGKKRQALLSKIAEIKTFIEKNADEKNASQLLSYLGDLSREVNGKKYGLVFEEHREKIDELLEENAPVFREDKKLFVDNGGELNFLLEGDNLASLKLLEKTHRGKIDVIYIDPPYNTGNKDFIYDDDFVDSTDQFRHSKWLSFMEKRLQIARRLLSEKGVIFISIDDNEQADLKLLCDEVFGEKNFVGNYIWRKKFGGGQAVDYFSTEHEYICVYRKTDKMFWKDEVVERSQREFNHSDKKGFFKTTKLAKWGNTSRREDRPSMYFSIAAPDGTDCFPIAPDGNDGRWRVGKDKMKKLEQEKLIHWEQKDGKWIPYEKEYFNGQNKIIKDRSIIYDVAETGDGSNVLTEIFSLKDVFLNPKPLEIIIKLLKNVTVSDKNIIILDFFAGSGTTGHAVLKLNAEDGGHRKFILCTNNENNICRDITYQRLKTAITGKRKDKSKYSDGLPGSLKYFKTDFIPISEKMYYEYADELLLHVRELVELENAVNFDKDTSVAIVLDDDEMDEFIDKICHSEIATPHLHALATNVDLESHVKETLNQVQGDRARVQGDKSRQYTNANNGKRKIVGSSPTMTEGSPIKTLYLGHDVLLSSKQERILKAHNISVNVIPDYYYRELAL